METVEFQGQLIPKYITEGFHSQFIFPVAEKVCIGTGYDIGCKHREWALKGSIPVDLTLKGPWEANYLPEEPVDYIFSSHMLEHSDNYVKTLKYWTSKIKQGGNLFLYLPHYDCKYWRPWRMPTQRHTHQFYPKQMKDVFYSLGYHCIFCSERDLAYSFAIYGNKS